MAGKRKALPIGLGYVVTAMKNAGYEFELLDLDARPRSREDVEEYLSTHRFDVVAMGCIVTGYKHVKWLSGTIKDAFPSTVIIVGNTVAQSIPQLLLNKTVVDIVVMGEGEETIVELLRSLDSSQTLDGVRGIVYRAGKEVISNPSRPVVDDVDTIPMPDWDLFDIEVYVQSQSASLNEPLPPISRHQIRAMPINTARGCPYKCSFCYHSFRGVKYRRRSPESIIREMRQRHERYKVNFFMFYDELTFMSAKHAESFADALIDSGLQVYWYADVCSGIFVEDRHVDVVKKLRRAGCMSLSFSLESADPDILKWMNKRAGPKAFSRQVEILGRGGMASLTSIVIGYPNETEETIKATIDCCIASGVYPSAGYLLPQPGTPMYDYAVEHGYIKQEEQYLLRIGDRQDLHVNMTQMSDEEMQEITERELARCSQELGHELSGAQLLKTGFYRSRGPDESQG